MTEKYIYADVEKPFHFWVREGQRWILRDGGADRQKSAQRSTSHSGNRHPTPGQGTAAS